MFLAADPWTSLLTGTIIMVGMDSGEMREMFLTADQWAFLCTGKID